MSLGISIPAKYTGPEDQCRERLRAFLEKEPSPVPGMNVFVLDSSEFMCADLFFSEENVYFFFENEGAVTISAKTNGTGPGYHVYLANLCERMKIACSLTWDDVEVEDESGYWHNRDFSELQITMGNWLAALANLLVEKHMDGDIFGLALSMDTDRVPDDDEHYAAHLTGWRERDFFREIAVSGVTQEQCASFFIWWEEKPDPHLYLNTALCIMWCECNWLKPETKDEKATFTAALLCLEHAWDDDQSLPYPVREWKEMALLSESVELVEELDRRFPTDTPTHEPIGYLRGNVRRHLGNGWRMTTPGSMHENVDSKEGTALVYWNERLTIRVTRLTVTGDNVSAKELLNVMTKGKNGVFDLSIENQDDILARAAHEREKNNDGSERHCSLLYAAVDAGIILYLIVYYNDESDKTLVEGMFASISWQGE